MYSWNAFDHEHPYVAIAKKKRLLELCRIGVDVHLFIMVGSGYLILNCDSLREAVRELPCHPSLPVPTPVFGNLDTSDTRLHVDLFLFLDYGDV